MVRDIKRISDHVVLCDWGLVGENTHIALMAGDISTVVVERDPGRVALAEEAGVMVVTGDASHDDVLVAAGIDRARAFIACMRKDSDNLVIIMSARHRRPDLMIIARASDPEPRGVASVAGRRSYRSVGGAARPRGVCRPHPPWSAAGDAARIVSRCLDVADHRLGAPRFRHTGAHWSDCDCYWRVGRR